jgi:hypothetical protein
MNPEPTDLNDLAAIARTTKSTRYRRALAKATSEIELLRAETKFQTDRIRYLEGKLGMDLPSMYDPDDRAQLRARIKELEGIIDWHIDMVVGDAWLCRIEGKFEDIDLLLGNAVGKQISAYEIDTSHHESTNP